jgi:hypothetical protein
MKDTIYHRRFQELKDLGFSRNKFLDRLVCGKVSLPCDYVMAMVSNAALWRGFMAQVKESLEKENGNAD